MTDEVGNGRRDLIPEELKEFVRDFIDSISSLEVLLLLRQRGPQSLSAAEVSRELRSNVAHTSSQLERLRGLSLAQKDAEDRYVFAPADARAAALVEALSVHYASHRVSLIGLIYTPSTKHEIKQFSDAFKLRKD